MFLIRRFVMQENFNLNQSICLEKAILDTQERIRDYMHYSNLEGNKDLQQCFRNFAETEGYHAAELKNFLGKV